MISDSDLRSDAARIRDRARDLRKEMHQRHSAAPNWDLVKLRVMQPLDQLRTRVQEELIKKTSQRPLVPVDRDPVPVKYQDAVQRYYQQLGIGK